VLTTYATLIADSGRNCILHKFHWFRIILDEGLSFPVACQTPSNICIAHSIRHQQTRQFRAVVALSANYRWCLTGTPIQNVFNDLGALVRFLRVPHLDGPSDFSRYIAGPIEKRNAEGLRRLRELLRCICLRRTKDLLHLPKPDSHIQLVQLTAEEKDQYCRIGEEHRRAIDEAIARGNLSDASSGLFRAILRLRIFCNSGLCVNSTQMETGKEESVPLLDLDGQAICSYCSCDVNSSDDRESASSSLLLACNHLLCPECVDRSEQIDKDKIRCVLCGSICPSPRAASNQPSTWEQPSLGSTGYSSKLEALTQNIVQHPTEKWFALSHFSPPPFYKMLILHYQHYFLFVEEVHLAYRILPHRSKRSSLYCRRLDDASPAPYDDPALSAEPQY
jgi:SNF2 family DNA or RNA helicase